MWPVVKLEPPAKPVWNALALRAEQASAFDAMLADTVENRLGGKQLDLGTFAAARAEALRAVGLAARIERTPNAVTVTVGPCPLYEGLRAAGLDHTTVEAMCQRGVALGYAGLGQAFPGLSGVLHFRGAPGQPCVEEFALEHGPRITSCGKWAARS